MTAALPLILAVMAVISFTACAQEVAYAYGESGPRLQESGNITQYNGSDIVSSVIASAGPGSSSFPPKSTKNVEEIKEEINLKLNIPNPTVEDKGSNLVLDYPGDRTIGQICSIYNYMVGNWSYKADTRGIEVFQYSNKSLENGEGRYSGQGDCDDFSILMASLIESIGGTSRIVLAYGPNGGHAYTEVYLGKVGGSESDAQRMIAWLRKNYNVKEINTHTDLKTDDVWLNLDWWREPGGAKHPGGPFFKAASQTPIPIRENTSLVPLMPLNDLPEALFTISPSPPNAGENASFDASKSWDIGGEIDSYLWDFGDGNKTGKMSELIVNHVYLKGGPCTVILTVEDDEGATSIISQNIMINNPPQANFTVEPQRPKVGDQVKFDASKSDDEEDGKNLAYHWEINNNSAIFRVISPPRQPFDEKGMYWINLTVTDKNGAKGYKNFLLKINQPPIPRIAFDGPDLSLGKMINFSAVASEDLDGEIVSYAWDFGDNSAVDCNKTVLHSYREGGEKTVRLSIRDNDGAINNSSQDLFINRPPIAKFSIDPGKPEKGEAVSFNASSSSDSDGTILKYSWDFGEGIVEPDVRTRDFAVHTYYRPQEYNVTLTVEDDKGATGSFSQTFKVKFKEINNNHIELKNNSEVTAASFSADNGKLATGSGDYTARLWNVQTGSELQRIQHDSSVMDVAFSPDGSMLATGSDIGARMWDMQTGKELPTLMHYDSVADIVLALAFSPDGSKLATGSQDCTARLWNVQTSKVLQEFDNNGLWVMAVALSPDGSILATGSEDNTARMWNVQTGKELKRLNHDNNGLGVNSVAFNPGGSKLATGCGDSTARLWNVKTGMELQKFKHNSSVTGVAFSPDGSVLATGCVDKMARIWDMQTGEEIIELEHNDTVWAVAFSTDGTRLATGCADGIARIWNVQSGQVLLKLPHEGDVFSVAFSS